MLETLKNLRRKIARRDITFWEILPLFIALVVPSILEPEWLWRLIAFCGAGTILFVICIHSLLIPEQFRFPNVRKPQNRRYFFWIAYVATIVGLPFIIYFFLIPSGKDIYRVIQNPSTALERKVIEFSEWGSGGAAPFFIGQSFYTVDKQMYFLPFSFSAWGKGTFEILYSPETDVIYEIKRPQ